MARDGDPYQTPPPDAPPAGGSGSGTGDASEAGDQDAEPTLTADQVEADSERDQAEGDDPEADRDPDPAEGDDREEAGS